MSTQRKFVTAALAGLAALLAPALTAQMEIAPYITVHYDVVHPEHSAAYEANGKSWVETFKEAGIDGEYGWDGYNADFTYAWVSDMPNWAYMDGNEARQEAIVEAIGEEEFGALMAGANEAVASHYTEVWKYEPEHSYFAEDFNPAGMAAVNVGVQHVKPGMDEEFRAVLNEVVAALKKVDAPIHFLSYQVAFGEGSYGFVSWGENRSALHSGPQIGALLGEALGAEGAQALFERWVGCITSVSDKDWRVRSDLSYRPDRMMEDDAG